MMIRNAPPIMKRASSNRVFMQKIIKHWKIPIWKHTKYIKEVSEIPCKKANRNNSLAFFHGHLTDSLFCNLQLSDKRHLNQHKLHTSLSQLPSEALNKAWPLPPKHSYSSSSLFPVFGYSPISHQTNKIIISFFSPFFNLLDFFLIFSPLLSFSIFFFLSNLGVLTNECRILEVVQSNSELLWFFLFVFVFVFFFWSLYPFLYLQVSSPLLRPSHYRLQAQSVAATKKEARKHQNKSIKRSWFA